MNCIYRCKLLLIHDLQQTFHLLQSYYSRISLCIGKPKQLVIKLSTFSILIFTSGQCRIMGRVSLAQAQSTIQSLSFIFHSVIEPLLQVSETVVFQLDSLHLPINLYKFAHEYSNDINVQFEPEIFPSLTLHYWKPLHVNVFSTGKVNVLGLNARDSINTIHEWLDFHLLLL